MATNFTNKYMQVFQNYNEFGEHSADYVRGEDHIAFLIEENEVIYWLYLEQVWRPLNVRTTTTGELEDGRTKVAVRLEYIEGGQKYTSVPNIPDPERITSMSHFLEDYPDIEEVNVSGTVNLTDLSYAFAGSKIKDFNTLDVSNVTTMERMLYNVDNENLDIIINNAVRLSNINYIIGNKSNINKLIIHLGNTISDVLIGNIAGKINEFEHDYEWNDTNDYRLYSLSSNDSIVLYGLTANKVKGKYILLEQYHLETNVKNIECGQCYIKCGSKNTGEININCERISLHCTGENNLYINSKYIVNTTHAFRLLNINGNNIIRANFGYGISVNNNFEVASNGAIGNFIFTTPIVDDTFYAKYAQYNTPISIFQYKTTFTEIADVNISSEVDSNLTYFDWDIDFDLSNTSIELYNNININTEYYSGTIKKLIVDNTNVNGIDKTNCPYLHDFYGNRFNIIEGYISGIFKSYNPNNESHARISESKLLKNIVLVDFIAMKINNGDFLKTNNIKFDYVKRDKYTRLSLGGNKLTELDTLINNNHIGVNLNCNYSGDDAYLRRIKNIDGVIFDIGNGIEDTNTNIYIIIDLLFKGNNNIINGTISIGSGSPNNEQINESIYINGSSKLIEFYNSDYKYDEYNYVKYIYGDNLIISIDNYATNMNEDWNLSPYKHIDINSVMIETYSNEFHILNFINCDNETNINLITKLVDNTSSSTATIYMYRSQSNIIGEENIAAAVAKNYEFAIIEN